MPNPFYSEELFVGRDAALSRLAGRLDQGRSTLLIGGRRAGKTTLTRHLTPHLVGRGLVRTDVSGWDLSSEQAALGALLGVVSGEQETVHSQASRHDVVMSLRKAAPLALVIDEADKVLLAQWGPGFFAFLRWLDDTHLRHDIGILLAGGPVLASFRDPDDKGSPPLNTAEPHYLDPLDRAAVEQLAANLPGTDVDSLMDHCGGHPWLTTRLLAALYEGTPVEDALDEVFDLAAKTFQVWERQLGEGGRTLLRRLPSEGVTQAQLREHPWSKHREAARLGRSIGALRVEDGRVRLGPKLFSEWFLGRDPGELHWDLAISYASEDEALARQIHRRLRTEFKVFYAPEEDAPLWGTNLTRVLPNTYGVRSRYVLVISTEVYATKYWTQIEYDAVANEAPERILLLDCGKLPDNIPEGLVYRGSTPAQMVGLIDALREKLVP
ncbi:MAG TPA: AAA family ATPase [Amycolatopsis sp.]|uniref:TIR domain-containing protein n=1 Tax=Amycolatopsis sp. TaxID=37632 RepID=UPI002B469B27|nr:AAA family ATPase [Amycolatopsis sp.]HKS47516.1 AAA family ATPase [Amycolatopsis sp.]